jgi:hypothetical protein
MLDRAEAIVRFYVGLHHPGDAANFDCACISINVLRKRKKPIDCPDVLVDSGAFTELNLHGRYRHTSPSMPPICVGSTAKASSGSRPRSRRTTCASRSCSIGPG